MLEDHSLSFPFSVTVHSAVSWRFHLSDGIGFMCLLISTVFAGGSLNTSWETHFLFFCAKETRKCTELLIKNTTVDKGGHSSILL